MKISDAIGRLRASRSNIEGANEIMALLDTLNAGFMLMSELKSFLEEKDRCDLYCYAIAGWMASLKEVESRS